MSLKQNPEKSLYVILTGIFITNALLAELIGGKLIQVGPFTMSLGVIPWPIVFLTTDLMNEYFGKEGVRRVTFFTVALVLYAFVVLFAGMQIPAVDFSPVKDASFNNVFGQSLWIIGGSLIAFMVSQLVDVFVFWLVRARTKGKFLWLRATGSTAVSQLIDTFVIMGIAFYLPSVMKLVPEAQRITWDQYITTSASNYSYKLMIAVAMTPIIYLGHSVIDRFLGREHAKDLISATARKNVRR